MSDAPPPGGYRESLPQPGGYQPPSAPQPPPHQFQPTDSPSNTSGNGCLKAFLIVAAITVVLAIIGTGALLGVASKGADEAVTNFRVADTKDYDVTIDEGSCKIDSLGSMSSSGVFTNKANRRQAYGLTVEYYDENNTKLKIDSIVATGTLDKDAKAKWTSMSLNTGRLPESIICKVSQVNYTS